MNTLNSKLNFPNLLWEIAGHNFPSLFGRRTILFTFIVISLQVSVQRMVIKTSTLEWSAAPPNLGVEFPLNDWTTAEIPASANLWEITDKSLCRHRRIQAEARYWLRDLLARHYIGITRFYSMFDVGITPGAYYGDVIVTGITYGYNWILSRRWNLEVSGGVGVACYRLVCYQPGSIHGEPNEPGWASISVKLSVSFIYIAK